jgi:acetyl-CoA carboxylase alpha subunit/acetyl-CoA carboxylase beta subunit
MNSQRLGAAELIRLVFDDGSFISWDERPLTPAAAASDALYAATLGKARRTSGVDEAITTGEGTLRGRRVAVVVGEFGFLAGSVGTEATERIVAATERATAEGIPLLAAPVSGGTRMQEGTSAFVGMVNIAAAVTRHRQAALPYLVYLRDPTTGGVFASWGSLGHITIAEPAALIGFLGPRVYEALHDEPFPPGVQVSENLAANGLIDAVVSPHEVADVAHRALEVLCAPRERLPEVPAPAKESLAEVPAWESITRSRRPERPGVRVLLKVAARGVVLLSGTGQGEHEPGVLLALARFGQAPAIVIGQDRSRQIGAHRLGPAALREARRGIRLAAELGLPLVTVIDTPGASLSPQAEENGLASEIARTMADLVTLPAPALCLLLGQGAGGGALALLPADQVVAAQHAWLSPLPPEGASAILHRTADRASEVAERQGVRSLDLLRSGIVDRVIAERPDAADEPEQFMSRVGQVLEHHLVALLARSADERLTERRERFRRLGVGGRGAKHWS